MIVIILFQVLLGVMLYQRLASLTQRTVQIEGGVNAARFEVGK